MALTRNIAVSNLVNKSDKENSKPSLNYAIRGKRGLTNISNKHNVLKSVNIGKVPAKKETIKTVKLAEVVPLNDSPKAEIEKSPNEIKIPKNDQTEVPMDISVCSTNGVEGLLPAQLEKICIVDIDKDDGDQPHLLSEYIMDIYAYLSTLEREDALRENFMSEQVEITSRMRAVLVDWLVQVHLRFHLIQETLFLTIAILDRYIQKHQVSKSSLQLVGVTAMWIACKYEEMYSPEVGDFVYITDNGYDKSAICEMERTICVALDFKFGCPLSIHFLRRFSKAAEVSSMEHSMGKYLIELSLGEYDLTFRLPSMIAAASLFLSIKIHNEKAEWTPVLTYYSGYSEEDLLPLVCQIASLVVRTNTATKLVTIRTKYQSSKFLRVARNECLTSDVILNYAEKNLIGS